MTKIKNDPARYVKRADLRPCITVEPSKQLPVSKKREFEFMSARIDEGFYFDFRKKSATER